MDERTKDNIESKARHRSCVQRLETTLTVLESAGGEARYSEFPCYSCMVMCDLEPS